MIRLRILLTSLALLILFALTALIVNPANAVPAFARKHNVECSECHSAWPLLNPTGRAYKENGYAFTRAAETGSVISDFLQLDETFPASAVIKARPYDKRKDRDGKIRAIHEFEIMVAGRIYKNISGFVELEAEDEESFEAALFGWVTWNAHELFNLQFTYDSIFAADPFNTFSGSRRLTRNRNSIIDQRFGGADNNGRLRGARQSVTISGRAAEKFFYTVGYSGVAGDAEGERPRNFFVRGSVDVIPEFRIGGFGYFGECFDTDTCEVKRDFTRLGVDVEANIENFIFQGGYMHTKDDNNFVDEDTGRIEETDNNAFYLEGIYTFRQDGRPTFVPLVRFDRYERADGSQDFTELTLNMGYYVTQNVRVYGEFWKQLDVPGNGFKDSRFTIQVEVGF